MRIPRGPTPENRDVGHPGRSGVWAAGLVCLGCLLAFVSGTIHWTLISDAGLMHYVGFLIRHHLAPYRDIADINMPGTYLLDLEWTSLFGAGALAWRVFDFTLVLTAGVAMFVLARPYSRLGGLLATSLFALLHGADGVAHAGERDFVVAVLLLTGCACLFSSLRRQQQLWLVGWGFCASYAACIKPQAAAAGIAVSVLAAVAAHRRGQSPARLLLLTCVGAAIPFSACLAFLLREHALEPFLTTTRSLVLFHASLGRHSLGFLLGHALPAQLWPLLIVAATSAWKRPSWPRWEGSALLLCMGFGLLSFVAQGKAYSYHRATLIAFFVCWAMVQIVQRVRFVESGGGYHGGFPLQPLLTQYCG